MSTQQDGKVRFAVVGLDSSHAIEFTTRLIGKHTRADQNLGVGELVAVFPGGSGIGEVDLIKPRSDMFRAWGATVVEKLENLIEFPLDGVIITSIDGRVHLEQVRPFIEAGIPTFVDKPLTCSPLEAREIHALAKARNASVFSSSSLRFDTDVVTTAQRGKAITTADVYCPAPIERTNPGLYWYGIHGVEMLYTILGPGCTKLSCCFSETSEVVTAVWRGGRVATLRGLRTGCYAGGLLYGTAEGVTHMVPDIASMNMYRELCKHIVTFFRTGVAPVDLAETVEIIDFIDAALKSRQQNGAWVALGTEESPQATRKTPLASGERLLVRK